MISVVIPACEEAELLPRTLRALATQETPHEIFVVDGGSRDDTVAIAKTAGAAVLQSDRRQRARQMNLGASSAQGAALVFLHADTLLAQGALQAVEAALQDRRVLGGGFARRYESPSRFLRITCVLAEMRTRLCGWFLGDQAIFVRRSVFVALGGFREWDFFEDLDFSRRLARRGRVVTLRPPVLSAARRFTQRGALRTTLRDLSLTVRYLAGRGPAGAMPAISAGRLNTPANPAPVHLCQER